MFTIAKPGFPLPAPEPKPAPGKTVWYVTIGMAFAVALAQEAGRLAARRWDEAAKRRAVKVASPPAKETETTVYKGTDRPL